MIINPSEPRVVWFSRKEAFWAGRVLIEHPDSVGFNSMAIGYEAIAKGNFSQSFGFQTRARGVFSTVIGLVTHSLLSYSHRDLRIGLIILRKNTSEFLNR